MFELILGIPAHPLIVHAAVVFVPLQIIAAIVYAFVPVVRRHIWWAVVALAVVGPVTAFLAKESGEAFQTRLINRGRVSPSYLVSIAQHGRYGERTFQLAAVLALVTLILVVLLYRARPARVTGPDPATASSAEIDGAAAARDAADIAGGNRSRLLALAFGVVILVLSVVTGYYVFRTGDTGAHIVWSGQ